jgi:hypothetical protein
MSVECIEDLPLADPATVTVSDNCTAAIVVIHVSDISDGNICPEVITRKYRATDMCGNTETCTQYITINDTTDPVLMCPEPVTVECLEDVPPADPESVIATDTCVGEIAVTHVGDVSNGNQCPEIIMRTYRATDACGNSVTCQQIITIHDTTAPEITCPAQIEVQSIVDVPDPDISQVMAEDNCTGDVVVTFVNDSSEQNSCDQIITRTYRATDACGNTMTCRQLIIVNDTTPPEITCPESLDVQCAEDVPEPNTALVIAHDNCDLDVSVMFVSDVSDGNACPEVITRTYRATDSHGNTAICTQYITIHDMTPPSIDCMDPVQVQCIEDVPPVDLASVMVSDNCVGDVAVTHVSDVSDGNTCAEVITRT